MKTRRRDSRFGAVLSALALATVPTLSGCAGAGSADDPFASGGQDRIRVEVVNLNWNEATLFAHRGEARSRIGIVQGKGEGTFDIPWSSTHDLRIEIQLLSQGSCMTSPVSMDPGDVVYLEIRNEALGRICRTDAAG